jgi:hypothetical protein
MLRCLSLRNSEYLVTEQNDLFLSSLPLILPKSEA